LIARLSVLECAAYVLMPPLGIELSSCQQAAVALLTVTALLLGLLIIVLTIKYR